ncbi:Predicted phosphohydrolase or phosphomutase, AlkP superfamily [Natronorubrum sediminis]|uniref:Predicted phosphohydrolase or phosphomutase, AlkP superfamily n=1 Tax=Natronorubrum sediminis TaxID=640943 RepID=A0A1H6FVG4_9EURY|nr:alkaline phosphatase family protein [Natronorubrum sediminis]SEH14786.1 Predicted phosphohydrolase or phosphomutase, AlkP superfamily [Natronorubrum sediminis]
MTRNAAADQTDGESGRNRMDALLIGIDAGCLSVFDRLADENVIPNLESLLETGVSGELESQIPPWTPSAWPSMFTGVNPGKHGVYGFTGFDGYDFHVVKGDDVRAHRLWTLLDHHDRSSVVVNVPVTHPPDDIDGAIIPGFIGPEDPPCHPTGILDDVREEIGEYRVYPEYSRGDDSLSPAEKMDEYCSLVSMRGQAFQYLSDRFEPDFGFLQFQKTDTVFHEFEGEWEKVKQVYAETDKQIGEVLESCNPRQVFIASDHGIGRYEKPEFRVNTFLENAGYVETTLGGKGMPTWNVMRDDLREGEQADEWEPGTVERLAAGLASLGMTTHRIGRVLERLGLAEFAKEHAPDGVVRTGNEQVDFPNSKAYVRARTELGVRMNVEGRDPEGVVPQEEYDDVRAALIRELESAEAPDGEPVFQEVAPREAYFEGPYTDRAVDIVTVPNDFQHFLSAEPAEGYFDETTEPWNHKLEGVFAASGEGIDASVPVEDAHLFDVAPTILSALGVPYSDRMDGRVLPIVEESEPMSYPAYHGEAADAVDSGVESRLEDLGYVQ